MMGEEMERWREDKRRQKYTKIGTIMLLGALLLAIHLAVPGFYATVWQLSMSGDFKGTITYLQGFGGWAMFVSFLIDVLINVVGFLPSIFLSTANGLIFGIGWGILISWLGETVGVIISFWFMRTLFRDMTKRIIEQNKMLTKMDEYSTLWAMALARAVPYSPNGLVTALGAFSRISYRDYALGCLLGKLPSVAAEVIIGHDAVLMQEHSRRLIILGGGVILFYGLIWWYMKKRKEKNS